MEPPKSLILLSKRCLKGSIIFKTLWLLSIIGCVALLFFSETRAWAVVAFMLGAIATVALSHVRERYILSKCVLSNQGIIYWAQPKPTNDNVTMKVLQGKEPFRLHLSNGDHLDVDVFSDEIEYFTSWVDQNNPGTFWGLLHEKRDS